MLQAMIENYKKSLTAKGLQLLFDWTCKALDCLPHNLLVESCVLMALQKIL